MSQLEEKLYEIHSQAKETKTVSSEAGSIHRGAEERLTPFLTVNQVDKGGPGDQAVLSYLFSRSQTS